jgi:chemotaxis signal transduction protein
MMGEEIVGIMADAQTVRDAARRRSGFVDVLVFRLGGERFAVGLAAIEEVIDLPELRPMPHMPPIMLGVCDVRADLTAVYTPGPVLGVRGGATRHAIIARSATDGRRAGLAIEEAEGVVAFDFEGLMPPANADGVVLGVSMRGGQLLAIVDVESLVTACASADRVLETP